MPALAVTRLQRWATTLSAYNYDIEFCPTAKHANADSLLKLPLDSISTAENDDSACLFIIQQMGTLSVDPKQLRFETANDPVLSRILRYTKEGWQQEVDVELCPFFRHRVWLFNVGIKVIVPNNLQGRVLELHMGHTGIARMKALAKSNVWWPGVEKQIDEMVQNVSYQSLRNKPTLAALHP